MMMRKGGGNENCDNNSSHGEKPVGEWGSLLGEPLYDPFMGRKLIGNSRTPHSIMLGFGGLGCFHRRSLNERASTERASVRGPKRERADDHASTPGVRLEDVLPTLKSQDGHSGRLALSRTTNVKSTFAIRRGKDLERLAQLLWETRVLSNSGGGSRSP